MKPAYFFGHLAKRIDLYAYPRTGSHYFTYCFSGLFDQISLPNEYLHVPEAVNRQFELQDLALYTLELRENHVPHQPVWLNPLANGLHGVPKKENYPVVLLIREPIATAYSWYRVSPRWGAPIADLRAWLQEVLTNYVEFYRTGCALLEAHPRDTLLVRFEQMTAGPEVLQQVVDLVGIEPKLRPDFVHKITRFENFVCQGNRTFYREGRNDAWRDDAYWMDVLSQMPDFDFRPFGYRTLADSRCYRQPKEQKGIDSGCR